MRISINPITSMKESILVGSGNPNGIYPIIIRREKNEPIARPRHPVQYWLFLYLKTWLEKELQFG
jgi:hypothetical protein